MLTCSLIPIGFVPMYCGHSSHCLVPGRMIKAMETSINRRMHNKGLFITSDNSSLYGEEERKEYERIRDIWENAEDIEVERGESTIIHYSLHSKKETLILPFQKGVSSVDGNYLVVKAFCVAAIFQFHHSSAQGVADFCAFHTIVGQDCFLDLGFTVTVESQKYASCRSQTL